MKNQPHPPVEGIVMIAGNIHCKSQEALDNVLAWLSTDYDIEDGNKDEDHPHDSYFASLKKTVCDRYAKCDYCKHYNSICGSKCHGFSCENCKKVLFKKYIHRSPVRLYFRDDHGMRYLNFIIHSYDEATESLLVYAKVIPNERFWTLSGKKAQDHLEKYKNHFKVIDVPGKNYKLLSFYYPVKEGDRSKYEKVKVSVMEVGHPPYKKIPNSARWSGYDYDLAEEDRQQHYSEVHLYKGKEYKGGILSDNLPVRDHYSIIPTFKRSRAIDASLTSTIMLAAGQVPDCGYYYQDGRQAFYDTQLEWMALYVENFTDLSGSDFRKFLRKTRLDGPGFIRDLAKYIEGKSNTKQSVENRPNIFNLIVGVSKIASGEGLTSGEVEAMADAARDEETCEEWNGLVRRLDK